MLDVKVKLCGFKELETIDLACCLRIDFMGFVFYDASPRNVDMSNIAEITKGIPENIKKVAVVVDASDELLVDIIRELKPDFLQLHGDEDLFRVKQIKEKFNLPIIKAFRISNKKDLTLTKEFEDVADYFLFDAKADELKGGSGKSFDWGVLKSLETKKEWFLSGGINSKNAEIALRKTGARMIDVSSALEEAKGIKSKKLIKEFVAAIS
jgi:phosphoribosylanthranilate isomerase